MSLASKIKTLRGKYKMSLQDVADAVGASKAHIWDLERGASKNPSMELLVKLAETFKVSIADLVGEAKAPEADTPTLVALYRDLRELSEEDQKVIQAVADRLKATKGG